MQIEKGSGSAPFYSCPVEANDYVDKKFIHNYREKSANLKKKTLFSKIHCFKTKLKFTFHTIYYYRSQKSITCIFI